MRSWKSYLTVICCGILMISTVFVASALGECLSQIVKDRAPDTVEAVLNFFTFTTVYELLFLLMILVMVVHIRNRASEYHLLKLMGMKKKHRRKFIICEYFGIALGSTIGGILAGMGVSVLMAKGLQHLFSDITESVSFSRAPIIGTLSTAITEFILLFFVLVILMDFIGVDSKSEARNNSGKDIRKRPVLAIVGLLMIGTSLVSLWFYWGRVSSALPVILMSAGLLLLMLSVGGNYLSNARQKETQYFKRIVWLDSWYSRFTYHILMSAVITCFAMLILRNFGIALFDSLPLQRDENYPYDLVWMANEQDEEFINALKEDYAVQVKEQPCIRVTSGDLAEHMGISASAYEAWTGERLQLADDEIHVIYQRNRSDTNKLRIDYQAKEPKLFIGKARSDLWKYVQGVAMRTAKFQKYQLAGEENRILTGIFKDAVSENVIVFSDDYYHNVRGDAEGANLAVMMNIPKDYEKVTREIYAYAREHSQKDFFAVDDRNLIYEKKVLALETRQNNLMLAANACLNMLYLLVCGVCVLLIKLSSDYPQMEWKYRFYIQSGMAAEKVRRCIRKEVSVSVWIPVVCGMCVSCLSVLVQIYLKHLSVNWSIKYMIGVLGIVLVAAIVFGIAAAISARNSIAKIERGNQNEQRNR